jgi:hypothetical protein
MKPELCCLCINLAEVLLQPVFVAEARRTSFDGKLEPEAR